MVALSITNTPSHKYHNNFTCLTQRKKLKFEKSRNDDAWIQVKCASAGRRTNGNKTAVPLSDILTSKIKARPASVQITSVSFPSFTFLVRCDFDLYATDAMFCTKWESILLAHEVRFLCVKLTPSEPPDLSLYLIAVGERTGQMVSDEERIDLSTSGGKKRIPMLLPLCPFHTQARDFKFSKTSSSASLHRSINYV